MPRTVIPFRRRQPPTTVCPLSATVTKRVILDGEDRGPWLEIQMKIRLADVPPDQRRGLAQLLNGPGPLRLTLSDDPVPPDQ